MNDRNKKSKSRYLYSSYNEMSSYLKFCIKWSQEQLQDKEKNKYRHATAYNIKHFKYFIKREQVIKEVIIKLIQ